MEKIIQTYVRERVTGKGKQKVGIIVGLVDEGGNIVTGWAKANIKAGDAFDKHDGACIALKRALGKEEVPATPVQMVKQIRNFQARCLKYFQQAKGIKLLK